MENNLKYDYIKDNIFDYYFMNDYTTILLAKEEYGVNIENLDYKDEDEFFCFSENRVYSEEELFRKYNIIRAGK